MAEAIEIPVGEMVKLVKIKWNEKFIRALQSCEMVIDREQFNTIHSLQLSRGGSQLREWLRNNKWRMDWEDGGKIIVNPDYLGFGLAFLSDYNKYSSWKDFSSSFAQPVKHNLVHNMTGGIGGCNCFCKKHIHQLFRFQNPDTGLNALLGNDCINTAFFTTKEERKQLEMSYSAVCPDCGNKTVRYNSNLKFSSECSHCSKTLKRCVSCHHYLIDKKRENHNECYSCWSAGNYENGILGKHKCLI